MKRYANSYEMLLANSSDQALAAAYQDCQSGQTWGDITALDLHVKELAADARNRAPEYLIDALVHCLLHWRRDALALSVLRNAMCDASRPREPLRILELEKLTEEARAAYRRKAAGL